MSSDVAAVRVDRRCLPRVRRRARWQTQLGPLSRWTIDADERCARLRPAGAVHGLGLRRGESLRRRCGRLRIVTSNRRESASSGSGLRAAGVVGTADADDARDDASAVLSWQPIRRTTTTSDTRICRTSSTSGCGRRSVIDVSGSCSTRSDAEGRTSSSLTRIRHGGSQQVAESYFEEGFRDVFDAADAACDQHVPMSFFYAFKQAETSSEGESGVDGLVDDVGGVVAGWVVGDGDVADAHRAVDRDCGASVRMRWRRRWCWRVGLGMRSLG